MESCSNEHGLTANTLPFDSIALGWLADHQLIRPVLKAHLLQRALGTVELTLEESTSAFQQLCQQRGLEDPDSRARFCREQALSPEALQALAERPLRLQHLCERDFAHKAEARFLDRKGSLDRVVYSLLRLKEQGMARELYFRIADGEADFAQLAQQFSQGTERQTRGIVGPVPIEQAHPELARRLRCNPPGVLLEPFAIEGWWLVVRVESYAPASFDEVTRIAMARELFEQWLHSEVESTLAVMACQLLT